MITDIKKNIGRIKNKRIGKSGKKQCLNGILKTLKAKKTDSRFSYDKDTAIEIIKKHGDNYEDAANELLLWVESEEKDTLKQIDTMLKSFDTSAFESKVGSNDEVDLIIMRLLWLDHDKHKEFKIESRRASYRELQRFHPIRMAALRKFVIESL